MLQELFSKCKTSTEPAPNRPVNGVGSAERRVLQQIINEPPRDHAKKMVITPIMARVMLERNSSNEWQNRPKSKSGLARYKDIMERGGWQFTGQPIIFSKSGNLLNGQHTLSACSMSEVTITALVVFGIEDDAFKYMDSGIARTASHIFSIEEIPNANVIAAAARIVYCYQESSRWDGHTPHIENDTLLDFYRKNEKLQDSLHAGRELYTDRLLSQSWASAMHYICALKSRPMADDFFKKIGTGVGISSTRSVEYKFRAVLLKNARANSAIISNTHLSAYLIKAWNAKRTGSKVGLFRWRGDKSTESFPRAI